eukprot:6186218-Pleurochrysis_carterae.AAC.1
MNYKHSQLSPMTKLGCQESYFEADNPIFVVSGVLCVCSLPPLLCRRRTVSLHLLRLRTNLPKQRHNFHMFAIKLVLAVARRYCALNVHWIGSFVFDRDFADQSNAPNLPPPIN